MGRGDRALPTVLLSIETTTRELDSKLVLASTLVERGCRAVVGNKVAIQEIAGRSRRILWLGKSVFKPNDAGTSVADEMARNGSLVMWHHDEGAIYPERVWRRCFLRSHPPRLIARQHCVRVGVWGERQRSVLCEHEPQLSETVVVTGSPRFDLCAPSYAWIDEGPLDRQECEPYILVNSRFPTVVHAQGPDRGFRPGVGVDDWPEEMGPSDIRDFWFSTWRQDAHDLAEFLVLIKELALSFPAYTVVVRPHPSESIAFHQQAFHSFPNIRVTKQHSVAYWIRGASLVVHCKCTTGVEAAIAGRPVLHFWPNPAADHGGGEELAREAGWTVTSVEAALDAAGTLLGGAVPAQQWSPSARELLHNLTAPALPVLADQALDVLREHAIDASSVWVPRARRRSGAVGWLRKVVGRASAVRPDTKRGPLDLGHVERVIAGCAREGIGRAELTLGTSDFVVLEPPLYGGA